MDNRENGDPARGPRRYGPSAGDRQIPAESAPPRQTDPPRAWSEIDNGPTVAGPPPGRSNDPRAGDGRPRHGDPRGADPRRPAPRPGDPRQPGPDARRDPRPPGRGSEQIPPRHAQHPPPTAVFPAGDPGIPIARPAGRGAAAPWPVSGRPGGPGGPGGPAGPGGPPRGPVPPGRAPRPENHRRVVVGRVVAAVLSVGALVATGFGSYLESTTGQESSALPSVGNEGVQTDEAGRPVVKGQNILLVGSDSRTDVEGNALSGDELAALGTTETSGVNTDTIMVIHIPDGGGRASAVSIPRDTWIYDPPLNRNPNCVLTEGLYDYSFENKVNSYYGVAKACELYDLVQAGVTDPAERERQSNENGRTVLADTVQRLTGLKIDSYAEVNLFGFYLLSDALGGVPVCLVADVDDPFSGAKFLAGPQEVSGSAALAFVRQRHGLPGGDLDRVRRQQAFLAGALDKVLSAGTLTNPAKLIDLIDAADRSIVLSEGFSLLDLAGQMSDLSSGNVTFTTIPQLGGRDIDGKDAIDVDPAAVKAFFADLGGTGTPSGSTTATTTSTPDLDPQAITVDVQNGTLTTGMAAYYLELAAGEGFSRGSSGDYPDVDANGPESTTTIRYGSNGQAAAALVRDALGVGTLQADDTIALNHVLVVVGSDAPPPPDSLRHAAFTVIPQALATDETPTGSGDEITAGAPGCVN